MCVVIDANCAHKVVNGAPEGAMLRDWIEARPGRLIAGGKNLQELAQNRSLAKWLAQLMRAGRLYRVDDGAVNGEARALTKNRLCRSDDQHIVALARVGGARILFSEDQRLHEDFLDPTLVSNPRGCVYQNVGHRHLLDDRNCCRR